MTDQQRLREALRAAVPEPPTDPWRAREARALSRSRRRRALGASLAALVAIVAAVPIVRSLSASDSAQSLDVVTHGTGRPACKKLEHHDGLGYLTDARVVRHALAAKWEDGLKDLPGEWTTVCVFDSRHGSTVVAGTSGTRPLVVARGGYKEMADAMTRLGALQERQPATVSGAPFVCPHIDNDNVTLAGSATLPTGATGARICDSIVGGPTQTLTSGVDDLVRTINAQPLTYWRGSVCGGMPGGWGYTMVIDYPTGTRVVAGDFCGWFGVGPVQRSDTSPTIGERFLSALRTQEESKPLTQPASCASATSAPMGPGDITRIVAARFCPAGATGNGVVLTAHQLSTLTRTTDRYQEWVSNPPEEACPTPSAGWPHLMLTDVWHQRFSATLRCRDLRYWDLRFADSGPGAVRPVLMPGIQGLIHELVQLAG